MWGETEAGRDGELQTHNSEAFQKLQRNGQGLASLCQLVTLAKWLPISKLYVVLSVVQSLFPQ